MLIEAQELCHVYARRTPLERQALTGVSLSIAPGESLGVAGQTGSGKSTLMQHLAGLLQPTLGQVLLDGVAAHRHSAAARIQRQRIGIAFQYPEQQIFEQTVYREVAFGPRNLGLDQNEIAARVRWALTLVGLDADAMMDRSPFALSGGEKRRVALAGVLALQPDVLILDEPTAGLDPRGRSELVDRVQAWRRDMKATLIVVSHDLMALGRLVDRVIVLSSGRIAIDGPARAVLCDRVKLSGAGLKPPEPVALLHILRDAGWPVAVDALFAEEAAQEIARAHSLRLTPRPETGHR